MRGAVAILAALAVLAGSAVVVAANADNAEAEQRARMIAVLGETTGADCDCTAGTRAQERIANGLAGDPSTR